MSFLLGLPIFRGYVKFQGCTCRYYFFKTNRSQAMIPAPYFLEGLAYIAPLFPSRTTTGEIRINGHVSHLDVQWNLLLELLAAYM